MQLRSWIRLARVAALLLTAGLAACRTNKAPVHQIDRAPSPPASAAVAARLILVGDAGVEGRRQDELLELLQDHASEIQGRTLVVWLGDNIYPAGMPVGDNETQRRILKRQIDAVHRAGARSIFVPGNHDWAYRSSDAAEGLARIQAQRAFIDSASEDGKARMLPEAGCPGPAVHDEMETFRLVSVDTQWFLHEGRIGGERECGSEAQQATEEERCSEAFQTRLRELLRPGDGRPVVVVAHHPLLSVGKHGTQRSGADEQDVHDRGGRNQRLQQCLEEVFRESPPLVYASGHDHSLQVLKHREGYFCLVSGAAAKTSKVAGQMGEGGRLLFAQQHLGFMNLDFLHDGQIYLEVVEPADGKECRECALWLTQLP